MDIFELFYELQVLQKFSKRFDIDIQMGHMYKGLLQWTGFYGCSKI